MPFSPQRLVDAREAAGLSQDDLGYLVGGGGGAIRKYERGDVVPGSNKLRRLARELGVMMEDLFDDDDDEAAARAERTDQGSELRQRRRSGTRRSNRSPRKDDGQ